MAMRLGDSWVLSTTGASCVVSSPVVRLAGGRAILGGLPSLESRRAVRHGSRKRAPVVVHAAKSAPESPPSASQGTQAQSHLDLLERMTENSTASQGDEAMTIRDQLASQVAEPEAPTEVVVPLATGGAEKDTPPPELTVSQKRNIRRQNYLNKVSERNDAPFFATVAGFFLVPPILILGFAVATGYVELFP